MFCKSCGQQNAPDARNCIACAAPLTASDAKINCPTCKAENPAAERYCLKCGSLLVKTGRPPAPPEPKKPAYTYRPTVRQLDPMPQSTVRTTPVSPKPVQQQAPVIAPSEIPTYSAPTPPSFPPEKDDAQLDELAAILASKNSVVCSYCGTLNENANGDCILCGEPLFKEETKKEEGEPKPAPKPKAQPAKKKQLPLHVAIFRKVFGLGKKKPVAKEKSSDKKKGVALPDKKVMIGFLCIVLALVLIIGIGSAGGSGKTFIYDEVDYKLFYSVGSGQALLYANGKNISAEPAVEEPQTVFYDMHNTCGIYTTPVQENGVLTTAVYYFNSKGAKRIINSVNSCIYLSSDGSSLLYIDAAAALCLYNIKSGESATIAENGAYISGAFALSPDGEYVMYGYRNQAGTNSVSIWHDGEMKDICSSGVPIAVSEGGKKVYYLTVLNNTYDFYVTSYRRPAKFTKIASGIYANAIKFNADLSEVLFTLLDGGTYYSKEGKQAKRVASSAMYPLICNTVNFKTCSSLATIYGVAEFFDNFWIGESGLYYVDEGEEPLMLVAGVLDYDLSADGNRLVFVNAEGKLFVTDRKDTETAKNPVAENVISAALTGNGKDVYYLNSVNALCHVNDKNESVLVAQEVDGIMCSEEGVYYKNIVAQDNPYILTYCSNAKSGKVVADSVLHFQLSDGCAYYTTGDGQHMYYSKNGNRSFKQLY